MTEVTEEMREIVANAVDPDSMIEAILAEADSRCGTHTGYVRHKRREEDTCAACMEAHRVYQAELRRKNRPIDRAKKAAQARLAEEYPVRYRQLLAEALEIESGGKQ